MSFQHVIYVGENVQEKKLVAEIKKTAKTGNEASFPWSKALINSLF